MEEELSVYDILMQTAELFAMNLEDENDRKIAKNVLGQYRMFMLRGWKEFCNTKFMVGGEKKFTIVDNK